mgnify:CR=1 FL=1
MEKSRKQASGADDKALDEREEVIFQRLLKVESGDLDIEVRPLENLMQLNLDGYSPLCHQSCVSCVVCVVCRWNVSLSARCMSLGTTYRPCRRKSISSRRCGASDSATTTPSDPCPMVHLPSPKCRA